VRANAGLGPSPIYTVSHEAQSRLREVHFGDRLRGSKKIARGRKGKKDGGGLLDGIKVDVRNGLRRRAQTVVAWRQGLKYR
jgi:hypothetical protein